MCECKICLKVCVILYRMCLKDKHISPSFVENTVPKINIRNCIRIQTVHSKHSFSGKKTYLNTSLSFFSFFLFFCIFCSWINLPHHSFFSPSAKKLHSLYRVFFSILKVFGCLVISNKISPQDIHNLSSFLLNT